MLRGFNKLFWISSILCVLTTNASATPLQWNSGSGANKNWYELVSAQVTWTEANAAANAATYLGLRGHLVTITSAEENTFIGDLIATDELVWIGLTDQDSEGSFKWVTNEPFVYSNWNGGEPSDGGAGEDFAEFIGFAGAEFGKWNDLSNTSGGGRFYVIEYEYEAPVPTPALSELATVLLGMLVIGIAGLRIRGSGLAS